MDAWKRRFAWIRHRWRPVLLCGGSALFLVLAIASWQLSREVTKHTFDRAVIHFFSSAGVYLLGLWGFWLLERKVSWWPELRGWWEFILPALLSFAGISLREVFDVAAGGALVKSVCDWLSWLLGLGTSVWAVYRLSPRLLGVRAEIAKAREERLAGA